MSKTNLSLRAHQQSNELVTSRLRALREHTPFNLEPAGLLKGTVVINDSAAISLKKSAESLSAFESPVIWLAEASQLDPDLVAMGALLKSKVKVLIGVGDQAEEVHTMLWPFLSFFVAAHTWEEALDMALIVSKANDTILFSPGSRACEPFRNYKERGAYFNSLVEVKGNLKTRNHG